jgi:hypothetical protein
METHSESETNQQIESANQADSSAVDVAASQFADLFWEQYQHSKRVGKKKRGPHGN